MSLSRYSIDELVGSFLMSTSTSTSTSYQKLELELELEVLRTSLEILHTTYYYKLQATTTSYK